MNVDGSEDREREQVDERIFCICVTGISDKRLCHASRIYINRIYKAKTGIEEQGLQRKEKT